MRMLLRSLLLPWLWLWRLIRNWAGYQAAFPRWRCTRTSSPPRCFRAHPKPDWVRKEIIRLKALMPNAGCRTIAHLFNRRVRATRGMTVGKTYVADTVRRQQYLIVEVRQKLKHRIPRPVPRNLIWGLDLTVKADSTGARHLILAIVDHASRACLAMRTVREKSTLMVLRNVSTTCQRYGHPKYLRTDNEANPTTWRFSFWLWVLGVRHQRTDPHCPWQNGRVERFFGTMKAHLDQWQMESREQLEETLTQFRLFYNHLRLHQHLQGRTPAEVWAGITVFGDRSFGMEWAEAWEGVLQEYYANTG